MIYLHLRPGFNGRNFSWGMTKEGPNTMEPPPLVTHRGGCHCGAVRFEVDAPPDLVVFDCNCSVCSMRRNTHFIVPESAFRLGAGCETSLSSYQFGTRVARHRFCKVCGIAAFYHPRSNPNGVAVTIHCIDRSSVRSIETRFFDGQNWEAAKAKSDIDRFSCSAGSGGASDVESGAPSASAKGGASSGLLALFICGVVFLGGATLLRRRGT